MKHATLRQHLITRGLRSLFCLTFVATGLTISTAPCLGQGPDTEAKRVEFHAPKATTSPQETYFNGQAREVLSPSALTSDKLSATSSGNQLSLLFDTARVSLQTESDPLAATWVGTITVPTRPKAGKQAKSYLQHVRGSVTKSADSKVTMFFELGGKGFVAEFGYGMQFDGNIVRRFLSGIKPRSGARYTATIVIHAERRDSKSALLVDIDSVDVEAR